MICKCTFYCTVRVYVSGMREENHADKPDNPDKGLQPLSEKSVGKKDFLLLTDCLLTSHILDSYHPEKRESKEKSRLI